jgi:uncharacterized membrane protein (UPF0127 family)
MSERFVTPLLRYKGEPHLILNERNGMVVADTVLSAFDSKTRRKGLLSFELFPPGHAMVIAPTSAVHTWFMRFPIDLAFIDCRGLVLKTYTALKPWRMAASLRADAVIELPAGSLTRADTVVGDKLQVVPRASVI